MLGVRKRGKTGECAKLREKKKWWVFSSDSLFPARKWKVVTQGGARGIDHPMQKKTQVTDIIKPSSVSVGSLIPQQLNLDSPHPW